MCLHACMCVCVCACECVCACAYIHMYTRIQISQTCATFWARARSALVRSLTASSSATYLVPPAYVSIRQHTSAYASIRQHTTASPAAPALLDISIRQHTSAFVSIRPHRYSTHLHQHTSAYVRIRPNTSASLLDAATRYNNNKKHFCVRLYDVMHYLLSLT